MAPEYAMHGQFSEKSDIFSFGVLVLEVVSGQKNSCIRHGDFVEDLLRFLLFWLIEILYSKCAKYISDSIYVIYISCFVHLQTQTLYVCQFFFHLILYMRVINLSPEFFATTITYQIPID